MKTEPGIGRKVSKYEKLNVSKFMIVVHVEPDSTKTRCMFYGTIDSYKPPQHVKGPILEYYVFDDEAPTRQDCIDIFGDDDSPSGYRASENIDWVKTEEIWLDNKPPMTRTSL